MDSREASPRLGGWLHQLGDDRVSAPSGLKFVQFAAPSDGTVTLLSGTYRVVNDAAVSHLAVGYSVTYLFGSAGGVNPVIVQRGILKAAEVAAEAITGLSKKVKG